MRVHLCPYCNQALRYCGNADANYEECPRGHGIWVREAWLSLLGDEHITSAFLALLNQKNAESAAHCPSCCQGLSVLRVGSTEALRCAFCAHVWLSAAAAHPILEHNQITAERKQAADSLARYSSLGDAAYLLYGVPILTNLSPERKGATAGICLLLAVVMIFLHFMLRLHPALAYFVVFDNANLFWHGGINFFLSTLAHMERWHLAGNLIALVTFGYPLERIFGNLGTMKIFFISALGAHVFSYLIAPHSLSLGASGGIFGMILALVRVEPEAKIKLNLLYLPFWLMAMLWIAAEMHHGGTQLINNGEGGDHIAHLTHLLGALSGFLCVYMGYVPELPRITERALHRNNG